MLSLEDGSGSAGGNERAGQRSLEFPENQGRYSDSPTAEEHVDEGEGDESRLVSSGERGNRDESHPESAIPV